MALNLLILLLPFSSAGIADVCHPESCVQAPQAPQQLDHIPTPFSFLSSFLLPLFLLGEGLVYIHVYVGVCMYAEAGVDLMSSPLPFTLCF